MTRRDSLPKASIGKILLALVIACIYIFLFGIVQVVNVSADTELEINVSIPEASQGQGAQQTQPNPADTSQSSQTLKLSEMKKPAVADYTAVTTAALTTVITTTEKDNVIRPTEDTSSSYDGAVIIPTPETSAQTQTIAPIETEPPETDPPETDAPETTVAQTEAPAPVEPSDGEQFTVYDTVTGTYYTGPAREIVARAVVGEIWNQFPDEAVKAQAVATYTYIKKSNQLGRRPETALKTDVYDRIYTLVDEVLGEGIYYNGELIQCTFFASSCGYTNSALNVWGVDYPYLRSVDCPLDESTDPNWGSTDTYSSADVKQKVQDKLGITLSGDPSKWFSIKSRLDGREHGWITSISVGGMTTANGKNIDGRVMRETVFGYSLKSAAFDISYDKASDTFTFTTYGHGHGVGLSQYGAKALAENGYSYKQILQHYFTGVEIY